MPRLGRQLPLGLAGLGGSEQVEKLSALAGANQDAVTRYAALQGLVRADLGAGDRSHDEASF